MINGRFSNIQQQLDDVKGRLGRVEGRLHDVVEELNATYADVRYVRSTVNMLVHNDAAQDAAIKTLSARVTRLEKKVGLTNCPPIISSRSQVCGGATYLRAWCLTLRSSPSLPAIAGTVV